MNCSDQTSPCDAQPRFWRAAMLTNQPGLVHGVTCGAWNMAESVGPDRIGTPERRRRTCHALGLPHGRLMWGRQMHGTSIAVVDDCGWRPYGGDSKTVSPLNPPIVGIDGLITDQSEWPLMVMGADCALLVVYDPVTPAVGVAHTGWRGTVQGMPARLVEAMMNTYASDVTELVCAVSPCAGACCYEVGSEVVSAFQQACFTTENVIRQQGKWTSLDLPAAIVENLGTVGVEAQRVDAARICTICQTDYFSYRRQGRDVGQMALIAAIGNRNK